ncbi:MAG: aldo/keto reductase [Anaerolineae bacterium]
MRYKNLHDGRALPVLGLGSAGYGTDARREADAIRSALDMGYTHIDTAEVYGDGVAEETIGKAIAGHDRDELFLTSKVSQSHLRYRSVLDAIEGSLRRLGTGYLDLYLIHWPNEAVPLEETFRALNELVAAGKTRYVGVSNFSVSQMERSLRLTSSVLATNQVHYSLFHRQPDENGVLEYCREHDMLLTAYTPVEHGRVTRSDSINAMARHKGATPAQIAIAWLIAKPGVITIPQSKVADHLRENLGALDVELSDEEMRTLDDLAGRHALAR